MESLRKWTSLSMGAPRLQMHTLLNGILKETDQSELPTSKTIKMPRSLHELELILASWGLLVPPGASWGLLGPPEASWGFLGPPGASWGLLGRPEERSNFMFFLTPMLLLYLAPEMSIFSETVRIDHGS